MLWDQHPLSLHTPRLEFRWSVCVSVKPRVVDKENASRGQKESIHAAVGPRFDLVPLNVGLSK